MGTECISVPYQDKYDPNCGGTQFVFNQFYQMLEMLGVRSHLVALPGEDLDRYIAYAGMICKGPAAKASFVELDSKRFERWKKALAASTSPNKRKIRLLAGDVLAYSKLRNHRVQDLGIGCGFGDLLALAALMLRTQSRVSNSYGKWKVQILDMCLRGNHAREIGCDLQRYLGHVGVQIKSINGKDVEDFTVDSLFADHGKVVHTYKDNLSRKVCHVRHHTVKLRNIRCYKKTVVTPDLHAYTCRNGSLMLQTMLVYK